MTNLLEKLFITPDTAINPAIKSILGNQIIPSMVEIYTPDSVRVRTIIYDDKTGQFFEHSVLYNATLDGKLTVLDEGKFLVDIQHV